MYLDLKNNLCRMTFCIFVILVILEYCIVRDSRDFIQIFLDVVGVVSFTLTLILTKTAQKLTTKLKIVSKSNKWGNKKDLILQDLKGWLDNIVQNGKYDCVVRLNVLRIVEIIKTYEDAFDNNTKGELKKLISILTNDCMHQKKDDVATLLSSILGKIEEDQDIDRIFDVLD